MDGCSRPLTSSVSKDGGPVYDTFWKFAAERQDIYFRRLEGASPPWSSDLILREHRFTNVYRALDKVSQYLITRVIYSARHAPEDQLFRILLFKIFNKIDTWELLERKLGEISYKNYRFDRYNTILTEAMAEGRRLYSGAYIMPSPLGFGGTRKHTNHLRLLELIMQNRLSRKLAQTSTLRGLFSYLRSFPSLGEFLALQYAIDINYSELTDYSESEFIVPGPGARRGIRKCFPTLAEVGDETLIQITFEQQEVEFKERNLAFRTLWGRPLQLIDVQNLFCEVDKYSRVAHPEVKAPNGRTRIKQKYRPAGKPEPPWLPPKWGLNEAINQTRE